MFVINNCVFKLPAAFTKKISRCFQSIKRFNKSNFDAFSNQPKTHNKLLKVSFLQDSLIVSCSAKE